MQHCSQAKLNYERFALNGEINISAMSKSKSEDGMFVFINEG